MATLTTTHTSPLALVFSGASTAISAWRESKKGKRGGGGGKSNKFKGRFQFTDVDEDKIARLSKRKQLAGAAAIAAKAPMAVWVRIVTDYGKTIMMDADHFESAGARNVASATPHFG